MADEIVDQNCTRRRRIFSPPEDTDRNWRCLLFFHYPGGHVNGRPASTCRWMWNTVCCAAARN